MFAALFDGLLGEVGAEVVKLVGMALAHYLAARAAHAHAAQALARREGR